MAEFRAFVGHSFLKADEELIRAFLDHFNTLEKAGIGLHGTMLRKLKLCLYQQRYLRKSKERRFSSESVHEKSTRSTARS